MQSHHSLHACQVRSAALSSSPRRPRSSGRFGALWLTDHLHKLGPGGPAAPMPESYLVLAAIPASTTQFQLGLLATSMVYRNPALLAKMITTLDVLSGGRAILGIGAGHPSRG